MNTRQSIGVVGCVLMIVGVLGTLVLQVESGSALHSKSYLGFEFVGAVFLVAVAITAAVLLVNKNHQRLGLVAWSMLFAPLITMTRLCLRARKHEVKLWGLFDGVCA